MNADRESQQKQLTTDSETFNQIIQKKPELLFDALEQLTQTRPRVTKHIQIPLNPGYGQTLIDIIQEFPLFKPRSSGDYRQTASLTIQTINQTIPLLASFMKSMRAGKEIEIKNIECFPKSPEDKEAANEMKKCLDAHGSDKASYHNYHHIYGPLLKNRSSIRGLLEIGLGTNNLDVVSNMGKSGKPGASLRAFRDFLEFANIYGADIDRRILFEEARIKTFFVDQLDAASFSALDQSIPSDLDMVIDDGLHSPNANIQTLRFGLAKIKVGGWVIIEDIGTAAIPVWEILSTFLPNEFVPHIYSAVGDVVVFAVQRLK